MMMTIIPLVVDPLYMTGGYHDDGDDDGDDDDGGDLTWAGGALAHLPLRSVTLVQLHNNTQSKHTITFTIVIKIHNKKHIKGYPGAVA